MLRKFSVIRDHLTWNNVSNGIYSFPKVGGRGGIPGTVFSLNLIHSVFPSTSRNFQPSMYVVVLFQIQHGWEIELSCRCLSFLLR